MSNVARRSRPVGDRLALLRSGAGKAGTSCSWADSVEPTSRITAASEDDEPGIARRVLGRGLLVESVPPESADEVAEPRARGMEVEKARRLVAGDLECVHDLRRDERPGLGRRPDARRSSSRSVSSPSKTKRASACRAWTWSGGAIPPAPSGHCDRPSLLESARSVTSSSVAANDDLTSSALDARSTAVSA